MSGEAIELNSFQQRVFAVPEEVDLFLGGGRGGGKSWCIALLILRHVEQYGSKSRILYIRKSYKGLADFENTLREVFGTVYGTAARYNAAEHVWRMPNGAYVELGQLESASDYTKYQGRSFNLLIVDEAGQFADPYLLDMLRSNLRGPKDMPVRMIVAANPAGVGHQWLAKRYVFNGAEPWEVFTEEKSKRLFMHCPSTFAGNVFIDRETYGDQLKSSCPDDPDLLRAWTDGDWAVSRGAMFATVLDEKRVAIPNFTASDLGADWDSEFYLSHDWGSAAPSVTLLLATSPGAYIRDQWFPRDSVLVLDEVATNRPGNYNAGLCLTVPEVSERILAMCKRWHAKPFGVADDACFARTGHSTGSIAKEFETAGVYFEPAVKGDRLSGLEMMRTMFRDAGKPDKPGLYIARRCEYLWSTLPYLARDERKPEDIDSSQADHGYDALRYGLRRFQLARFVDIQMPVSSSR